MVQQQPGGGSALDDMNNELAGMNGTSFSPPSSGGGAPADTSPRVWMGGPPPRSRGPAMHADVQRQWTTPFDPRYSKLEPGPWAEMGPGTKPPGPDVPTADEAKMRFYTMWADPKKRKNWLDLLHKTGALDADDNTYASAEKAWGIAVDGASAMYTASNGKLKVDPRTWLKEFAGLPGADKTGGSGSGSGQYAPAGTSTQTNKTIPYQDPAALRAFIKDGVHTILGRKVDDDELDDMMHIARQYVSPTVTRSTTTTDGKGNTSTVNKTVKPGTSEAAQSAAIEDAIKAKPEYASYQAAGTMMNWLMGAVGAGGA